jgi:hypothetical protein
LRDTIWTLPAPGRDKKAFGKDPTQTPVALVERGRLAAAHEGDRVLDPFISAGTSRLPAARNVACNAVLLLPVALGVQGARRLFLKGFVAC